MLLRAVVVFLLGAICGGQVAWAQQGPTTTIILEEEKIVGEVPKPTVSLLISVSDIQTDDSLELNESLLPKIIASLEEDPF